MTTRSIKTRATLLLAAGFLSGAAVFGSVASATKPDPVHKVTICHRTNSVTNPYTNPTVDEAAVNGLDDEGPGKEDHNGVHGGPVFDVTADPDVAYPTPRNGDQWGDIIPPFYEDGVTLGDWEPQNWNSAGQAIFFAGCTIPPVDDPCEDLAAATYNPTTTTTECEPPVSTTIPEVTTTIPEVTTTVPEVTTTVPEVTTTVPEVTTTVPEVTTTVPDVTTTVPEVTTTVPKVTTTVPESDRERHPDTGANTVDLAILGIGMVTAGSLLFAGSRKART